MSTKYAAKIIPMFHNLVDTSCTNLRFRMLLYLIHYRNRSQSSKSHAVTVKEFNVLPGGAVIVASCPWAIVGTGVIILLHSSLCINQWTWKIAIHDEFTRYWTYFGYVTCRTFKLLATQFSLYICIIVLSYKASGLSYQSGGEEQPIFLEYWNYRHPLSRYNAHYK